MSTREAPLKSASLLSAFPDYLKQSMGRRMALGLLLLSLLLVLTVARDLMTGTGLNHGGVRPVGIFWLIVVLWVRFDLKQIQRGDNT